MVTGSSAWVAPGARSFFGNAAALPEGVDLGGVEFRHLRFDGAGEGEVHIVAAEEDVFADGDAFEGEFARIVGDADEGEVGGAAADVDNEDKGAGVDAFAPVGGVRARRRRRPGALQGGRGGGSWLLGGFEGEVAGGGVEGGRDGEEDVVGVEVRGGGAEVGEVGAAGFDGGEVGHFRGDSEPGFSRVDEAVGVSGRALGQFAGDIRRIFVPGQGEGAGRTRWGEGDRDRRAATIRRRTSPGLTSWRMPRSSTPLRRRDNGTVGGAEVDAKGRLHAIPISISAGGEDVDEQYVTERSR
jgi:hypothetical protein